MNESAATSSERSCAPVAGAAAPAPWWRRDVCLGCVMVLLTFAAYQPVWFAGFIWDDDILLTKSDFIKSGGGLWDIWFSTKLVDYFPMTSTAFWLQWRLWGDDPLGYHLVNVTLHAAGALVWWRVLRRLRVPAAWFVAMIYAVHPVNVESVAWISELKNTLAMLFFAFAALAYVQFEDRRAGGASARGWYVLTILGFLLAMLSKSAVAAFPLVVLAYAWWRRGRIGWGDVVRSLPFFALAVVLAMVTVWVQYHRAIGSTIVRTDDFWSRLAGAGWAIWFYLGKALFPANLSIVYPRWEIDGRDPVAFVPFVLGMFVFAILCLCHRRFGRTPVFASVFFVAMLAPILGFFNVGAMRFSLVADRWQYFALLAPIAVAVTLVAGLRSRLPARVLAAAGIVLVVVLAAASWRHAWSYRSPTTLWAATLATNPDCSIAHNEVGSAHMEAGRTDEAIAHFRRAIALLPTYEVAFYNYGVALLERNETEAAIRFFQRAVAIEPDLVDSRYNLGTTLLNAGRPAEAVPHLQHALRRQPDHGKAHNNLATALLQLRQFEGAVEHYRAALAIQPDHATARNNFGWALLQLGRLDDARTELLAAARLQPNDPTVHGNLAECLLRLGDHANAVSHLEIATRLEPDNPGPYLSLGHALVQAGRAADAVAPLQRALQLAPEDADAHNNLGNALVGLERWQDAIASYRRAVEAQPRHARAHHNLGALLAREGRLREAVVHFERAVEIDPGYAGAHRNLGDAWVDLGAASRAITHYEAALRLSPDDIDAMCKLAWTLATSPDAGVRQGSRALALAQRAQQATGGGHPVVLRVVAAGLAETGRHAEAAEAIRSALQRVDPANAALIASLNTDLSHYLAGRAMRDTPPPTASEGSR